MSTFRRLTPTRLSPTGNNQSLGDPSHVRPRPEGGVPDDVTVPLPLVLSEGPDVTSGVQDPLWKTRVGKPRDSLSDRSVGPRPLRFSLRGPTSSFQTLGSGRDGELPRPVFWRVRFPTTNLESRREFGEGTCVPPLFRVRDP